MKTLIFGGFLGSGKTTIIRAFIDAIVGNGLGTVAIIENEIGEVGIDDAILTGGSVKITPLFGGCVCCEITGSLLSAVAEIHTKVSPDWLIIELTGVAEIANVKELLESYTGIAGDADQAAPKDAADPRGDSGLAIAAIAIVDAGRWSRLRIIGDFIRDQIQGCDLLIINKVDLCDDTGPIADELAELTGVTDISYMSADGDRVADSLHCLEGLFFGKHDHDHEYEQAEDDHDHEHEHDERVAGTFSSVYTIDRGVDFDKDVLVEALKVFFTELGDLFSVEGIIAGHVKGLLSESADSYVRFSLTRLGELDLLMSGGWITTQGNTAGESLSLTINVISMAHSADEIQGMIAPVIDGAALLRRS